MVVDEADDMEAVGHDHGVGKLRFHDRAIDRRQVHADDADLVFAFQTKEIGL